MTTRLQAHVRRKVKRQVGKRPLLSKYGEGRADMKWFRFYAESLHHPKIQRLSPVLFKHWVNLLCLVCAEETGGQLPDNEDIAFHLGVKPEKVNGILDQLIAARLFDGYSEDGNVRVHNWAERQPRSDNAAERMRQNRRTSSEQVQDDVEHVRPRVRVEESREDQSRKEENREESDANAAPTSVPVLSVLSGEPVLTDFEQLRDHWKQLIGPLTTDQSRCLREHYGGHKDWVWAAVNETTAVPKPSWAYYTAIMERCIATGLPPSSLAKVGAR